MYPIYMDYFLPASTTNKPEKEMSNCGFTDAELAQNACKNAPVSDLRFYTNLQKYIVNLI